MTRSFDPTSAAVHLRSPAADGAPAVPRRTASDHSSNEDASALSAPPQAKKQRLKGPAGAPRRRAATACNFCRSRKTRCNNARPSCGTCVYNRVECVYQDAIDDQTSFDPASRIILDRLDELKQLLQASRDESRSRTQPETDPGSTPGHAQTEPSSIDDSTTTRKEYIGAHLEPPAYPDDSHHNSSCEAMLRWPIFQDLLLDDDKAIVSFVLDSPVDFECSGSALPRQIPARNDPIGGSSGIQQADFVPLCKQFLGLVHAKNPILDESDLLGYARDAAENGLGWDGPSCLVLLACALACIAVPWKPPHPRDHIDPSASNDMDRTGEDMASAEAYFLEAKKRMGLLQTAIVDLQCLFIASIYEKFLLRPLRSWQYIQAASLRLQTHLARKNRRYVMQHDAETEKTHQLEQRLFLSCVRAESEFLPYIPLRPSGIQEYHYPDLLPSPPVPGAHDSSSVNNESAITAAGGQQGWIFYLTEISVRRNITDVMSVLYRGGERQWTRNIKLLLRYYTECKQQVDIWKSHIPGQVQFDDSGIPRNEVSSLLQGRLLMWDELIARPILYYVLHTASHAPENPELDQPVQIAQQSIYSSAKIIMHMNHNHRHGGTYFSCAVSLACALNVLAAVLSGGRVMLPEDWPAYIRAAHRNLSRWATEAPQIEWMRAILHRLFHKVCQRVGYAASPNYLT